MLVLLTIAVGTLQFLIDLDWKLSLASVIRWPRKNLIAYFQHAQPPDTHILKRAEKNETHLRYLMHQN